MHVTGLLPERVEPTKREHPNGPDNPGQGRRAGPNALNARRRASAVLKGRTSYRLICGRDDTEAAAIPTDPFSLQLLRQGLFLADRARGVPWPDQLTSWGSRAMSTLRNARFATLLAVALALVITGAVPGAAGQALILGASNSAGGSTTSLTANVAGSVLKVTQNGPGTPLTITGPSDKAPMNVSSSKKVTNLNADRVDGQSAAAFMPSATYRKSSCEIIVRPAGVGERHGVLRRGRSVLSGGHIWNVSAATQPEGQLPARPDTWIGSCHHRCFANIRGDLDTVIALAHARHIDEPHPNSRD